MPKTFHGSCHCRAITYEFDQDSSTIENSYKCNCRICIKQRIWGHIVPLSKFRLLTPTTFDDTETVTTIIMHLHGYKTRFCKKCGTVVVMTIIDPGYDQPDEVRISVNTLDDLTPEELVKIPVRYLDGSRNDWRNAPETTQHL